jgi:hypothetical protein
MHGNESSCHHLTSPQVESSRENESKQKDVQVYKEFYHACTKQPCLFRHQQFLGEFDNKVYTQDLLRTQEEEESSSSNEETLKDSTEGATKTLNHCQIQSPTPQTPSIPLNLFKKSCTPTPKMSGQGRKPSRGGQGSGR